MNTTLAGDFQALVMVTGYLSVTELAKLDSTLSFQIKVASRFRIALSSQSYCSAARIDDAFYNRE